MSAIKKDYRVMKLHIGAVLENYSVTKEQVLFCPVGIPISLIMIMQTYHKTTFNELFTDRAANLTDVQKFVVQMLKTHSA